MSAPSGDPGRPRFVDVVIVGGLAVGATDIVNAMAFWHFYSDTPPARILQAVAAGLLGKESFAGGPSTAAIGALLHFGIAIGMAAVWYFACLRWPAMLRRPLLYGLIYGAITWVAMNYLIVPLSRATPPPFIPAWFIDGVLAHLVLVGLLLAFVARWSAGRSAGRQA